jgi:hypothetical protein
MEEYASAALETFEYKFQAFSAWNTDSSVTLRYPTVRDPDYLLLPNVPPAVKYLEMFSGVEYITYLGQPERQVVHVVDRSWIVVQYRYEMASLSEMPENPRIRYPTGPTNGPVR